MQMGVVRFVLAVGPKLGGHPVVMNIPHPSKWGITGRLVDACAIGVHDKW